MVFDQISWAVLACFQQLKLQMNPKTSLGHITLINLMKMSTKITIHGHLHSLGSTDPFLCSSGRATRDQEVGVNRETPAHATSSSCKIKFKKGNKKVKGV